jgi:hypothetical protein
MMNAGKRMLVGVSAKAIRLFPLAVASCVLLFPAYKGIFPGYVPVLLGAISAWLLTRGRFAACRAAQPGIWSLYVLPFAVQMSLLLLFRPEPQFDGLYVYRHAVDLLRTGQMDPMTYYPPAMTWWYAGWFWLLGASPLLAQFSQIPLALGVTWSTVCLVRELTADEKTARLAGMAVAWYPTFLGYVLTTPYYHYLYTLFTVLMVWMACRFWNRSSGYGCILLAGIFAGCGALTKAVQLVAPLQLACWLLVAFCAAEKKVWTLGRLIPGLALFGGGLMLVLLPWMTRNWIVFREVVPVCTSGGLVLYSANNPSSNGLYSDGPDKVQLASPREMLDHTRWCSAQARAFMRNEPRQFVDLAWRKFLHTWGSEATFTELINWRGQSSPIIKRGFSFIFLAGWAGLVTLWTGLALNRFRRNCALTPYEAFTGVMVLSNALIYIVFEGGDRHHLPLVPLLVALVAEMLTESRRREHPDTPVSALPSGPAARV